MFKAVYALSQDAWRLETWNAASYSLGSVFCTLCRYGITILEAFILTDCVSGLQNPQSIDGYGFLRVVFARISLSGLLLGIDWILGDILERAERNIRQVRTQKVIEAFYKLEFALMTDENFNRFMRLSGNIIHYPTYFGEPIDLICRTVEMGITAVIVGYNISRLTPVLGTFCVLLTALNAVKVMCALPFSFGAHGLTIDNSKAKESWKPKSVAE